MLDKSTTQSHTHFSNRSWSSYFTWAAKAMTLLGGIGAMGVGILRYMNAKEQSAKLVISDQTLSLRLETDVQNILSLPISKQLEISIPESFSVKQTYATGRRLMSASAAVLNPISDSVININEAYDFTIDVNQLFGGNMEVVMVGGNFPAWMNHNYYPKLSSFGMPGNAYSIKIIGTTAYIANGAAGLYILDITQPTNPTLLGHYDTPGTAYNVEILSNTAYVADGGTLQILNITHFANITSLGSFFSDFGCKNIMLKDNIAYFLGYSEFLYLFNVTHTLNAGIPLIGIRALPLGSMGNQVVVTQATAYVAATTGVYTFSINPPTGGIFRLGICNVPRYAEGVTTIGNIAYVADGLLGLQIISVMNPIMPRFLGNCDTPGYARKVIVVNNTVYLADSYAGLQIINATNPTMPYLLGNYDTPDARDVVVLGNIAYVANGNYGLYIINVTNPTTPSFVSNYDTPGNALNVVVIGTIAYVADDRYGLQIINVTEPTRPNFLGNCNIDYAYAVAVIGNTVYVASGYFGLQIINVTSLAAPRLLGSYNTPGIAYAVVVIGNIAYVANGDSGLQVINITNPIAPSFVGNYDTSANVYDVSVIGSIAYIADGNYGLANGLEILNIANPANQPLQSNYSTTNTLGLLLFNRTATIALGNSGFQLLSTTNVALLPRLCSIVTLDAALSITQVGITTYILEGGAGIQMFNVANVTKPSLMGAYDTPGFANSMTVVGSTGYIADGPAGLQIINLAQARLQGIPSISNIGDRYTFTVVGTDSLGNFATDTFQVTVARFPIVFQTITPPKAYWEQKLFNVIVPINTFSNPDTNSNPLSYSATLSDNSLLPSWINFNATSLTFFGITPDVITSTSWVIRLKASNTLGGYVSTTFPITVNPNSPPVIVGSVPFQYAKVDQPYNYFIPQGMFIDPDGDPLLFSTHLVNSTTLPTWLNFDPVSATFSGLPHSSDRGNFTLIISATDNIAGVVSTQFGLYVSYLPQLNGNVPAQVVGVGVPYQYPINRNIFSSLSESVLVYDLRRKNGLPLPQWLHFNTSSFVLSGIANRTDIGIYPLQITASDAYQGAVSALFDLTVENFPSVQHAIPNQVAGINQAFSYTLPAGVFIDNDGDVLTYQAQLASGASLPNWLQWDTNTKKLTGTPQISNAGNTILQIIATDPIGGSAATSFQLLVIQFPLLNHPITPPGSCRVGKTFSFTIPIDTFSDPNHLPLTYTARLISGDLLPTWLSFYSGNLTFIGTPLFVDGGSLLLQVTVTNSQEGFVTAPLTFHIVSNSAPIVVNPISNLVAQVGSAFKFAVPSTTFSDPDGDDLTYTARLSDGSPLPAWLQFNGNIFSGTPGGDDTNFYQTRVLPIALKASDGAFSAVTSFNISVEGVSTGEQVVKIVTPILSALGTSYGVYKKRALLFNNCCKKRYQRLENTAIVGEFYSRELETHSARIASVTAKFKRSKTDTCIRFFKCQTNAIPGGASLPDWLEYDEATNTLRSKSETGPNETNIGTLIIQVKNTGGVILEQFELKVVREANILTDVVRRAERVGHVGDDYDASLRNAVCADDAEIAMQEIAPMQGGR